MKNVMLTSLLLSVTTFSFANTATTIDEALCANPDRLQDPHYIPYKIGAESQTLAGQCVDSEKYRHTKVLAETADSITFNNYRHNNRYYTATIPKSGIIEKAYFHVVRFPIITGVEAAHTQIRLKMSESFKLVDQITGEETSNDDFVISYEAANTFGGSYNFAKGAFNNYPFLGRVLSGAQRVLEYSGTTVTEQYELNLTEAQMEQILVDSVKDSAAMKMDSFYNTIHPNCTTRAFDILDGLDNLAVPNPESFLTVLGNDPVAGPSIQGLQDRRLLVKRVSNLKDEIENGENRELEIPSPPSLGILTELEGKEYSLVYFSEAEESVSLNNELIEKAQKEAYEMLPMLMQSIMSASMDTQGDTLATLGAALDKVREKIGTSLTYLDGMATSSPVNVTMLFVPWDEYMGGEKMNPINDLGVKAKLPFESYKIHSRSELFFASLNMYEIQEYLRENASEDRPVAPLGFNVSLHLEKGKTRIVLQNVTHLQPLQKELTVSNSQVNITEVAIPRGEALDPAIFITLGQKVGEEASLVFDFAGFEGIYGDNPESAFDDYKLGRFTKSRSFSSMYTNSPDTCHTQKAYTPRLIGTFTDEAHSNGIVSWILEDRPFEFQIFAIELDLDTLLIKNSNINVEVESLGVRCMTQDDVNTQFADAGNQELLKLKKHFQVDAEGTKPMLNLLEGLLSGNIDNIVPGI